MQVHQGHAPRGVYVITPDWSDTARLCKTVEQALRGGAGAVQLRNKTASAALRRELALALAPIVRAAGRPFFVDNDLELAIDAGADGLHIGRDDGDPAEVRAKLPSAMMLGVSCYADLQRVQVAMKAEAAYVALGAIAASKTKVGAALAPLERITEARRLGAHVAASGGIDRDNIARVAAAGALAVGVVSAIFDAQDPQRATAELVARFAMGATGT